MADGLTDALIGQYQGEQLSLLHYATELNLKQLSIIGGVNQTLTAVVILATGWLADRFHPIRVVIAGLLLQVFLATPATCLWLFTRMSSQASFHYWLIITMGLMVPASALWTMLDPPLLMRIFPRNRLGQFCSANAITRAISINVNAAILGGGFILLQRHLGSRAYLWLPIWQLVSFCVMLLGVLLLYRSWKRYGGAQGSRCPISGNLAKRSDGLGFWPAVRHINAGRKTGPENVGFDCSGQVQSLSTGLRWLKCGARGTICM